MLKDFFAAIQKQEDEKKATSTPTHVPQVAKAAVVQHAAQVVAPIKISPKDSGPLSSSLALSITILAAAGLLIDASQVPTSGTVGVGFEGQLSVSGGTSPYQWTLVGGALPDGLTLDENSGLISGTPTAVGEFAPVIQVVDSSI